MSFAGFEFMGINASHTTEEKVTVSAESAMDEVPSGAKNELYFDVKNAGDSIVDGVKLRMNDNCIFEPQDDEERAIGELQPQEMESWTWEYRADQVDITKDCNFHYQLEYDSNASARYKISALSEDEYLRLKRRGELENSTQAEYYKTKGPFEVDISFSREQPYIGGDNFTVNIEVVNQGDGRAKEQKIDKGDLVLEYPDFLELRGCQEEMIEINENKIENDAEIYFVDDRAGPLSCKFNVKEEEVGLLEKNSLVVDVRYKYLVYKQLPVKVVPR